MHRLAIEYMALREPRVVPVGSFRWPLNYLRSAETHIDKLLSLCIDEYSLIFILLNLAFDPAPRI